MISVLNSNQPDIQGIIGSTKREKSHKNITKKKTVIMFVDGFHCALPWMFGWVRSAPGSPAGPGLPLPLADNQLNTSWFWGYTGGSWSPSVVPIETVVNWLLSPALGLHRGQFETYCSPRVSEQSAISDTWSQLARKMETRRHDPGVPLHQKVGYNWHLIPNPKIMTCHADVVWHEVWLGLEIRSHCTFKRMSVRG